MSKIISTTGASLKAVLCFIDPENTPKIAYDKDEYAKPLIKKIKNFVGNSDGSQIVLLCFYDNEDELLRQFNGVCKNIKNIMNGLEFGSSN